MKFGKYYKGQQIPEFIGRSDSVQFDISDSGAVLLVTFNGINQDEVEQFASSKRFEIRFTKIYGVIMVTVKIGSLNWMDAPYTPHLSKDLTKFTIPQTDEGLALQIILIDSSNGEIKSIRVVGLSEKFTRSLFGTVMEQKLEPFDHNDYNQRINRIYATYPTKKIVEMSTDYYKIN